ncbi:MAG: tRNA (adenosine(37)-N6)-threonylcarbamoyltransferase complex ATPase subunit type 1 TsaE [Flavobacterium sp. BFFFF2]|nr:MAG: tRNA (adenosine(37)-N6)-threonylcarbamoyltransferase complex ATPase subunit type 1 TsaE [Flavobacterium sp. BFFFF2]
METLIFEYQLAEIDQMAQQLTGHLTHPILILNGEMGAGKTTLSAALLRALDGLDLPSSPTFSLLNPYRLPDQKWVYHFDFYRIKKEQEAIDIGVDDYFYSGERCWIEWAERIPNLLPDQYHVIQLTVVDADRRRLELKTVQNG